MQKKNYREKRSYNFWSIESYENMVWLLERGKANWMIFFYNLGGFVVNKPSPQYLPLKKSISFWERCHFVALFDA